MLGPSVVVAWVMLIGLVVIGPVAAIDGVPEGVHASSWAWLAVSACGSVGGLVLTYSALRLGQVALVAPIVSTEGAIAALIAVLAGESLAAGVVVALVAIAGGIVLSSLAEDEPAKHDQTQPTAIVPAVLAALAFGASLYATGRAGAVLPSPVVVAAARLFGVVVLAVPLAIRGRMRLTRQAAPLVLASGLLEVLGFLSYTAGARHGIAIAAVLSSQFALLAAVGAYALFGERLRRIQLLGVSTVLVGVAVLSALRA
jgi:drug/metabolite transporter (DMT)-like permease